MKKIKKLKIESSTIENISYDINKRLLEVEFKKGTVYQYKCVDIIDVVGMIFAESSGSYFMKNIAKSYNYEKVGN